MKKRHKRKIKRLFSPFIIILMTVCLLLVFYLGDHYFQSKVQKEVAAAAEYGAELAVKNKQEKEQEEASYSDFYKNFKAGKIRKIKLIGDSITAGVGVPSHFTDANGRVIFDNGKGEIYHEAALSTLSWANYFRNYVHLYSKDTDFINAGIGGKSAEWVNQNKAFLISDNEDVVFVMLGANDRSSGDIQAFKKNLEEVLSYVDKRSKLMYVMSTPPALNDNEFPFGAKEINDAVKEICTKHGYTFLSHYEHLIDYAKQNNLPLSELLQSEGSHPTQKGYDEMWVYLAKELTLK